MSTRKGQGKKSRAGWFWLGGIGVLAVAIAVSSIPPSSQQPAERDPEIVAQGQALFQGTCASCHGADLEGTTTGPPFLHPTYAPNHHGDEAFQRAVALGVIPHHWAFGEMPPQPDLSRDDVAAIVEFVRSEQEAAGVFIDPTH